ncbi:MAG: hypothetical protein EA392_00960, partial [Cryomorphaceae bacterium]
MTKAELIQLIENTIFPNVAGEIDAGEHQQMLKDILEAVFPEITESTTPTWTSTSDVLKGSYWFFNNRIWLAEENSGPTYGGAVEPGSDPLFWTEIDASALAHVQNTDLKLGRYETLLDGGGTQTFNLTQSQYKDKNYFVLESGISEADANYTLRTVDGTERKRGWIFTYVVPAATYTITFETNAHQNVGEAP